MFEPIQASKKKIIRAPYIDQTSRWPTGCESVTATMLLQYLGIGVTVDEFIKYLPMVSVEEREGQLIGGDPNRVFVGTPYSADSYGCYAPVIVASMNQLFADKGLPYRAKDATGVPIQTLLEEQIDKGMPVIFWQTIDTKPSYQGPEWQVADTGETFCWTSNEHCLLLVGYDEENLYFNDPWQNHGLIGYERELVEQRHGEMLKMAVVLG